MKMAGHVPPLIRTHAQTSILPGKLCKLTPREKGTLACLARGESNKAIACSLDLAESTVKIHV
jgi:two-component system nitrate/nitrite response regulator NarL